MFNSLKNDNFLVNLDNEEYMFESELVYPEYNRYKGWNKLINKITSV